MNLIERKNYYYLYEMMKLTMMFQLLREMKMNYYCVYDDGDDCGGCGGDNCV